MALKVAETKFLRIFRFRQSSRAELQTGFAVVLRLQQPLESGCKRDMNSNTRKLADLHQHLYGSIHWQDFLQFLKTRSVDWTSYESAFQEAYGDLPPIRQVLEGCTNGGPESQEAFHKLFVFGDEDGGNFLRFQAKYNMLVAGSAWSTFSRGNVALSEVAEEVARFMRQILERQIREGLSYSEQRMTLNPRFTQDQARELLLRMLDTYSEYEGSGIQPRLAVSLSRDDPWVHWDVVSELALGEYGHLLTGVDFCYFEEGYPPKGKREFFEAVKEFNFRNPERALAILYHVGESFADKSLESAVRWVHEAAEMGAHRLGHAIALGISPELYGVHSRRETVEERIDQLNYDLRHREGLSKAGVIVDVQSISRELEELRNSPDDALVAVEYDEEKLEEVSLRQRYAAECIRDLGSIVEVCPTSNRRIGGILGDGYHPIRQFVDFDLPFVVGSDDLGIFDTSLTRELEIALTIADLPAESYAEIAERSWRFRSEVMTGRIRADDG